MTSSGSTSLPKKLKNGTFSKAKSNKTPSWLYKKTVGDDESYSEHIMNLYDKVDMLWHCREWYPVDINSIKRWKMESYGIARRLGDMYRILALFKNSDTWVTPRVPICKTTGYCQFKQICISDNELMRSYFKKEKRIYWSK